MVVTLSDRMKQYEVAARTTLPRRLPIIVRIDGKAFHTYTKKCQKPFDERVTSAMTHVAHALCKNVQDVQCAYIQSDEISLLLNGYKQLNSSPWFDNDQQKIVSVSAAIASATMTQRSVDIFGEIKPAFFDSRAFVMPESDVCNYFIWRQSDAMRNSVAALARSMYSDKLLHGKNSTALKELCVAGGTPWESIEPKLQTGVLIKRRQLQESYFEWVGTAAPLFVENRHVINNFFLTEEEQSFLTKES